MVPPEGGISEYSVGQELVVDLKTGLLRHKRRGRRRAYTDSRCLVVAVHGELDQVVVDIVPTPRGGIRR